MSIRLTDSAQKNLDFYCREIVENSKFDLEDYDLSNVKRGLRNPDGTGVTAGVTNICNVEGYYIDDNERIPREGKLRFRGINMRYIVEACEEENRFGYEEVAADCSIAGVRDNLYVKPLKGSADLTPVIHRVLPDFYTRFMPAAAVHRMLEFK